MNIKSLSVSHSKRRKDFELRGPRRCDMYLIHNALFNKRYNLDNGFDPSLIDELESRGYDTKTLKFAVKLKESK